MAAGTAPSGARLWLLVRGRRGDVQPLVALALGLRDAGYEVKVFGAGLFGRLFAAYGLQYEAVDLEVAWKSPEGSKWLEGRAASLGFDGPDELLLELDLRKYEVLNWQALSGWRRRLSPTVIATLVETDRAQLEEPRLAGSLDRDAFSERESARYQEVLGTQCCNGELVSLEQSRRQLRRALAESLRSLAAAAGCPRAAGCAGARAALAALQGLAARELAPAAKASRNGCAAAGCEAAVQVLEELLSWTDGRGAEEYVQAWQRRLPAWDLWDGPSLDALQAMASPVMCRNMLDVAGSLQPDERPALVLYAPLMAGVALALQRRHNLQTLAAWPRMPVLHSVPQFMIYSDLAAEERFAEHAQDGNTPLEDMGPVAFSELMRASDQLLGASPTLLEPLRAMPPELGCNGEWLGSFRARMTGHWHLAPERQAQLEEPYFFGGPKAPELARRFITEAERPPVCIDWGNGRHAKGPKALVTLAVKALRIAWRRGILVSSWPLLDQSAFQEALSELDEPALAAFAERGVLFLRGAPHAWLLPHCSCTVTHGGSGSLDAALRAGVPTILAPARAELLSRAQELTSLGCGLGLTEVLSELTPWKLATAVKVVLGDDVMKARAQELAAALAAEPGVSGAVEQVAQVLAGSEGSSAASSAALQPPIWAEGVYDTFTPSGCFAGRAEILGGRGWLLASSAPSMWLRAGTFVVQSGEGQQVPCNVEAFFPEGVRHAQVSEDGESWTWLGGERYQLKRGYPKHCECVVA